MAELSARERAKLPDSAFAYIDSTGRRRLPIHDEAHVRNALARFSRLLFDDESMRDRARTRLLRAAKRHGIVPVGFIDGQLRPRLPSGNLMLLFADVENSTRHLTELEDRYGPMISAVRRVIRRAVRNAGGFEVDARADEFFAVFERAPAALDAAVAIQRAMEATAWVDGRQVRVRVGLHSGRPTPAASGYVGIAVNVGSRICGSGHGRQIVLSRAARAALGDATGLELRSLGAHRLRGIPDEQELFQVVADGLIDGFPPLRLDR
ncbi:MAG: adenylate/guanylate cyclase domain-containing protein [Candidatus Limnocylindria bacterium]